MADLEAIVCSIPQKKTHSTLRLHSDEDLLTIIKSCAITHLRNALESSKYREAVRWPNGSVCPHCGNTDQKRICDTVANPEKKIRTGLRQCAECHGSLTITAGTIFEDSHIPFRKGTVAWYMLCSSKKGVSTLQIQRQLDIGSFRSACQEIIT